MPSKEAYIRLGRGMQWASEACRLATWSGDHAAKASWEAMMHTLAGYSLCLSHMSRRRIQLGLEWPLHGGGQ